MAGGLIGKGSANGKQYPGKLTFRNGEGWRYSLGFAAVPAVMIVIGAIFLPDSPSSLIERGKDEKAKQELIKIRGTSDVEEEFKDLVEASQSSAAVNHPWATLLKRHYRPQLVMAIAIPFFQQLTGMNIVITAAIASKFGVDGNPGTLPKCFT
ncbi:hypothetical protein AHAS_Ahas03G0244500 [Arachis hypogaea]